MSHNLTSSRIDAQRLHRLAQGDNRNRAKRTFGERVVFVSVLAFSGRRRPLNAEQSCWSENPG